MFSSEHDIISKFFNFVGTIILILFFIWGSWKVWKTLRDPKTFTTKEEAREGYRAFVQKELEQQFERKKIEHLKNALNELEDVYGHIVSRSIFAQRRADLEGALGETWRPLSPEEQKARGVFAGVLDFRVTGQIQAELEAEYKEKLQNVEAEVREFAYQLEDEALENVAHGAVSFGRLYAIVNPRGRWVKRDGKETWISYAPGDNVNPVVIKNPYRLWQPLKLRQRHTYIIGKTGKGKSNLLTHLILQDIEQGRGVGVLAPEADIFRDELLTRIPSDRITDVIYFNPEDQDSPVVYNPFHLDEGEQINLKASETFAVFERAMSDLTGARMRPLLSNSIYALCERPNSTIVDLATLIDPHDPGLRQEIIETTKDEQTRKFWRDTFTQYPAEASLPLLNRLDDFLRPPVNTVMGAYNPSTSLNFRAAMDEGKILLFNLSTGLIGERVSQLLGQLIVAKIQQAIWSREAIPKEKRRPFFFFIDEFQTYTSTASQSYSDILAKARKYGLSLYLAHQQTKQIPPDLLADILGNVSTMCVLTVAMQDAQKLGRELFLRDPENLARLPVGAGYVKLDNDVRTVQIPLVDDPKDYALRDKVIASSKALYGSKGSGAPTPTTNGSEAKSEPLSTIIVPTVTREDDPEDATEDDEFFE